MPVLENNFLEALNDRGLSSFIDQILPLKKQAINLIPCSKNSSESLTGKSKLGGNPSVPKDFIWPQDNRGPLSFIAQVELNKLPELAEFKPTQDILLSFFYNNYSWGFSQKDSNAFRIYSFDKSQKLIDQTPPELAPKKSFFGFFQSKQDVRMYKECCLETEKILSLPIEIDFPNFTDENWDNYFELLEDLGGNHRMFGYPGQIQAEVNVECEFVARGYEGIKQVEPSVYKEIEKASQRWQLLLQIDSDMESSDMMWGDGGRLFFMIDKDDLEKQNFENCWLISQCH